MTGLTDLQQTYLAEQMNKVSRSFALVAPALEEPLDSYLATAYLICRVLDNIEDCTQPFQWQQARFLEFATLLRNPVEAAQILSRWEREAWPGLSRDEVQLMSLSGGHMLWEIYAHIPAAARDSISHWAQTMARGMERVQDPVRNDIFVTSYNVRLPADEDGYDLYCFYVAGTVGHMITELANQFYGLNGQTAERLLVNSEASGRALQKTNIVKDFAKDLRNRICFLPDEWLQEENHAPLFLEGASIAWKAKVLENVLDEFEQSVDYVLDLPLSAAGFRRASLLMMLPAYQTLLNAARSHESLFTPQHDVKISRLTMAKCLLDARSMALDNNAILAYSRDVRIELSKALGSVKMVASK